jgi:hypothetical protein
VVKWLVCMLVLTTTTPYKQTSMDAIDNLNDPERALLRQLQYNTQAAQLAAEEEAKKVAQFAGQIQRAADKRARYEKAARHAAEEAARLVAEEVARLAAKEKARVRAAAEPKTRTVAMRQEPPPAHSSNRNLQAGVATSFVKGTQMHKFNSKGVEANNESGHWSEGGLSDDIIMGDAETTVSTSLLTFMRKLKTILA